jgi:hypothetical protein
VAKHLVKTANKRPGCVARRGALNKYLSKRSHIGVYIEWPSSAAASQHLFGARRNIKRDDAHAALLFCGLRAQKASRV